jgi:hypothetical protein
MRVQQIVPRTTLVALSSAILLTSGCASIVGGLHQSIDVETLSTNGQVITGASCELKHSKGTWLPTAMRYVASGEKTMVAAHADEARLCDIDAPLPTITVLDATQHGTLQVKRGGFAAPDDRAEVACPSGFLYGAQIVYRSEAGFHGLDHLRYEVHIGPSRFTRNVDIAVK